MILPNGATVAVVDGENIQLFLNKGPETRVRLVPRDEVPLKSDHAETASKHQNNAANHDRRRHQEDVFAASSARFLNRLALEGKIDSLVLIADPRTLGEMRKHLHATLHSKVLAEVAKEVSGRPVAEIEAVIAHATNS